jgi:hypothetical protein
MPDFLHEEPGKTVFEGDVSGVKSEDGAFTTYEVQNGGWNWMGPDAPETLLCEQLLKRFDGKRVRVTIEELGPSEDFWIPQREAYYQEHPRLYILGSTSDGHQPRSDAE